MMRFELLSEDQKSNARCGKITTGHGEIYTPIFMPVGTRGTVKAVHQYELQHAIQAEIILGNTYHLYLRPGLDILEKAGGLHQFNGWNFPILTDSGGYQVYSLAEKRKINEEGVTFQSHIDGSYHLFTPENVMDIQRTIGADIMMAFDECPPYPCDYNYARDSMHLTHRWLDRCTTRFEETTGKYGYEQTLFPIVQGSVYPDLREQSAEYIAGKYCAGNAIGGLSVGEPAENMYETTAQVCNILPHDKPRYLMGVGTPENILECIALGVDMFDCVMPTRNARNGMLFTSQGIINIRNKKWAADFTVIDPALDLYSGVKYTKAYLRHLIHTNEMLGGQIASMQNLGFYLWMIGQARMHIQNGDFARWKNEVIPTFMQRL